MLEDQKDEFYVYQLKVEGADSPFYIGKGNGDRMFHHLVVASQKPIRGDRKGNTIKKAFREGKRVVPEKLVDNISEAKAFELEIQYIAQYGRLDKGTGCLTNLTDGGDGVSGRIIDEDWKKQHSTRMTGEGNPAFGRVGTEAIAYGRTGEKHPMYGKSHSDESKRKISESLKNNLDKPIISLPKWTNGKVNEGSLKIWSLADLFHEWWVGTITETNPLGKSYSALAKQFGYIEWTMTHNNIIKHFRKGWNPSQDESWTTEFLESGWESYRNKVIANGRIQE